MNTKSTLMAVSTVALLLHPVQPLSAATSFNPAPGFGSGASDGAVTWDVFTTENGGQGVGVAEGANAPTATLTTTILVPFTSPPGGLGFDPDTYYSHDGAFQWSVDASFAAPVAYARVSYALFGGGMGEPEGFPVVPSIAGANLIGSGTYADVAGGNTIFHFDFELPGGASAFASPFGDMPAPFSSFRSVNAVRVEGLTVNPVPEPTVSLLLGAGMLLLVRRSRVRGQSTSSTVSSRADRLLRDE